VHLKRSKHRSTIDQLQQMVGYTGLCVGEGTPVAALERCDRSAPRRLLIRPGL
jgi:hypothetical protein